MRYAIVIEKSATGFAGYVPDLPGVAVTGDTVEEVKLLLRDAVAFHLEGLREDDLPIPAPMSEIDYIDFAA